MHPYLPLDIVLNIMDVSVPNSPDVLLDAAHPTTKLLLTFTLVCRETRKLANRYLRQHCVYLDSGRRLDHFLRTTTAQPTLQPITSLTLSSSRDDTAGLPMGSLIQELLFHACQTLRKLVIDMPLSIYYLDDDRVENQMVLREGFMSLANLEEFVSIKYNMFFDTFDDEHGYVWSHWPRLKRVALWGIDADENYWRHVALHPSLLMIVLCAPNYVMEVDPKEAYLKHSDRPIHVVVSLYDRTYPERLTYEHTTDWEKRDPKRNMRLGKLRFPDDDHLFSQLSSPWQRQQHQKYIRHAAEDGTLWEAEYEEVMHPAELGMVGPHSQ